MVVELLETYHGHTPERVRRLTEAVTANDLEEAVKAAHSLKSGSLSIGATAVAERAGEAEKTARAGDLETLRESLPALQTEVRRLLRGIGGAIREIRRDLAE